MIATDGRSAGTYRQYGWDFEQKRGYQDSLSKCGAYRSGSGVCVEVSNTGRGIGPAIRQRMFEPFLTTRPPESARDPGLNISCGMIRDHGGAIEVESGSGSGSTFRGRLPMSPPTAAASATRGNLSIVAI